MRDYILYALCVAGVSIAGYAVSIGGKFLKAKLETEKAKAETEGKNGVAIAFDTAAKIIGMVTQSTVAALEQTKGKDLRNLVKDGKIDRSELLALADEAYDTIISTVKEDVIESLGEGVADIDTYINSLIEEKLLEIKNSTPVTLEAYPIDTEDDVEVL